MEFIRLKKTKQWLWERLEILSEVSVSQLKLQNPGLKDFINDLTKKKVANKYFQWAVNRKKEQKDDFLIYTVIDQFDKLLKGNKISKAIRLGLANREQGDISYWHKRSLENLKDFIDRLHDASEIVKTKKEIKVKESEVIYSDDRLYVVFPKSHEASCVLGAGTKWCVASKKTIKHWNEHFKKRVIYYVFNKLSNPLKDSLAKIAIVYARNEQNRFRFYEILNAKDKNVKKDDIVNYYGKDITKKIFNKIESFLKSYNVVDNKYSIKWERADLDDIDLKDAIKHIGGYNLEINDFEIKNLGEVTIDWIEYYEDISSWIEVDKEDYKGMDFNEKVEQFKYDTERIRLVNNLKEWGISPIVMITAPIDPDTGEFDENGRIETQLGDGRGRVNFAIAFGLKKLPAVNMVYKREKKV